MKITDINFIDSPDKQQGLTPIKMKKLENVVIISGKNGSGKTRLLDLIKSQTGMVLTDTQINDHQANIKRLEIHITNHENHNQKDTDQITRMKDELKNTKALLKFNKIVTNHTPESQLSIIDFVPKGLELTATKNLRRNELDNKANNIVGTAAQNMNDVVFPYIETISRRYLVSKNSEINSQIDKKEINKAIKEFDDFNNYLNKLLKTSIEFDIDGDPLIFNMKLDNSKLSNGQKIILQFIALLFKQNNKLGEQIIFMDEPENHLHPSAINDIISRIQKLNNKGQIWISTHSVHILSMFDPKHLWYMENGSIHYAGYKPEEIIYALLGNDDGRKRLHNFLQLPDIYGFYQFTYESFIPPSIIGSTTSEDTQFKLFNEVIEAKLKEGSINILDYGCGKGRIIDGLCCLNLDTDILDRINYCCFDIQNSNKKECLSKLSSLYSKTISDNFYNDLNILIKDFPKYFDIILLANVFHEIHPNDWEEMFSSINQLLSDKGHLIVIEDQVLSNGENAHNKGFIVLDEDQYDIAFSFKEGYFVKDEREGKIKAHYIPQSMVNSYQNNLSEILESIKQQSLINIEKISKDDLSFTNGKKNAFWHHQYINAERINISLSK
jgi:ABC-type cobalamin/Fe3+-siderophores transport system ATPase subunit